VAGESQDAPAVAGRVDTCGEPASGPVWRMMQNARINARGDAGMFAEAALRLLRRASHHWRRRCRGLGVRPAGLRSSPPPRWPAWSSAD